MTSKIIRKCENCGTEKRKEECTGWSGGLGMGANGRSKYGKQYEKRGGWAWFCTSPVCRRVQNRICYRKWLPGLADNALDVLIDAAEMEKIREN